MAEAEIATDSTQTSEDPDVRFKEMKSCYGKTQNAELRFISRSQVHFIATDDEKWKECAECPILQPCSWKTSVNLMKQIVKMIDENRLRMGQKVQ